MERESQIFVCQSERESSTQQFHQIKKNIGRQMSIIQKTIPLAKVRGRRFDIRVMMMRNSAGKWEYAGMLAKVAGPRSIITNVRRGGGYALKVESALAHSLPKQKITAVKRQIIRLGYKICRRFEHYRRRSQLGIDFAVDQSGRIYIIEVNHEFPSHALFLRLKDKTFYRKIRRLAREYKARKRG